MYGSSDRGSISGLSAAARISERQRSFKKGIDADMTRRRREGTTVQIRKTIKEDRLNQRRRMNSTVRMRWWLPWLLSCCHACECVC